ncbi:MAG: hypothetical protein WA047_06730 [Phenylobacterium sp.]|uniref:hypothetical protein n=1 Tax=Phenylobacterium sp. TaxID=1871053 RepID=UPI003BB55905
MKNFGAPARAAIAAGTAIGVGAARIDTAPDPVLVWSGYGELEINGETYIGVGDHGLMSVVSGAVGGAEQNIALELSGVDPETLALFDMQALRRAPVVCYRLVFDGAGRVMLAAPVFARGRLDQAPKQETPGGTASIRALVETAARGLGRAGGRVRSAADQALVDPADDGLNGVTYAGQTLVYWGGKPPSSAYAAFGGRQPLDVSVGPFDFTFN